jgi:hypothetical protein
MPRNVLVYRCLVISPGDVEQERDAISAMIDRWNGTVGSGLDVRLDAVRWERHAVPDLSAPVQQVIKPPAGRRLRPWNCDFLVTTRHPNGIPCLGSVEELEKLRERGAHVLVYRKNAPIPPSLLQSEEYGRLEAALAGFKPRGLLGGFETADELRDAAQAHITTVVGQLVARDRAGGMQVSTSQHMTAARPDIRVRVRSMVMHRSTAGPLHRLLALSVENHSPNLFFLASTTIEFADVGGLWMALDILRTAQSKRLEPGDAHTMYWEADELRNSQPERMLDAVATDKIGRQFRSDPAEFAAALVAALNPNDQATR